MKKKEHEEPFETSDADVIKAEADAEVAYQQTLAHPDQELPDPPAPDQELPDKPGRPVRPDHDLPGPDRPDRPQPQQIDYDRKALVEGYDGGPPVELDFSVQHMERKFTHAGVHYEHVSETVDGQWIYRAMP